MDTQTVINFLFGLIGGLGGWVLNSLRASISSLQKRDQELTDKVQHIELVVAGKYVTRDEMEKTTRALFAKLDKIELKIDGKADK